MIVAARVHFLHFLHQSLQSSALPPRTQQSPASDLLPPGLEVEEEVCPPLMQQESSTSLMLGVTEENDSEEGTTLGGLFVKRKVEDVVLRNHANAYALPL